ncbi:8-amino-7-oxononanoate synthase [Aliiglaciecola sp.]|nr:8-amino-7-oxononanoate synthase [Aliiglaciecola sp.]
MAFAFIQSSLAKRQQQHILRKRTLVDSSAGAMMTVDGSHYINFSGNDYLGQRQNMAVMQAWVDGISEYGVGSGASPLVTGHTRAHDELECYLAQNLGREKALLFNSGFAANQALCQALLHKDSLVVSDKLMHASFIEGAMHSNSAYTRFNHNDLNHLSHRLKDKKADTLVATEGVFSMDGDQGKLSEMSQLCTHNNAWLMVDDAHGIGVFGSRGLGSVEALGLSQHQVPIVMGTFGKAIGTAGAFIAGSANLIDYLINFAKHYVYSTAMPPALASATLASFKQIQDGEQQTKLHNHISLFTTLCKQAGIKVMPSTSAIQPVLMGNPEACLEASLRMRELGLWVAPIRYPTVPKGQDRLRITLSASHHQSDIEALVDVLQLVLPVHDVKS